MSYSTLNSPYRSAPPSRPTPPSGRLGVRGAVGVGALAILAGVGVGVAAGQWFGGDGGGQAANAAGPVAETHSVERIASTAGCPPQVTVENAEYRQAACAVGSARYTITTFASDQNQEDWLEEAHPYGGAFLIGKQWVVSASTPEGLAELAGELGGTVMDMTGDHHTP